MCTMGRNSIVRHIEEGIITTTKLRNSYTSCKHFEHILSNWYPENCSVATWTTALVTMTALLSRWTIWTTLLTILLTTETTWDSLISTLVTRASMVLFSAVACDV